MESIIREDVVTTKRLCFFIVLMILLTSVGPTVVSAQVKFGYVDSQRIFATFQLAIDTQKRFEEERTAALQELQNMEQDFMTAQQSLEQQSLLLSEEKKRQKQQELQDMYLRIQNSTQDKEQELGRRREELLQPVYAEIDAAIKKVSTAEGCDFVMDALNLLDAKEEYDLTEKIMKELGIEIKPKTAENK